MEKIFLSLFLLTSTIYGMEVRGLLEEPELSRKVSTSHRFLVGIKEVAHSMGCYKPLQAIESGLSNLSESYRYNNMLARVTFTACVIVPELRERSEIVSVRLSSEDLIKLHSALFHIRNHVIEIAENQNLESSTPLMIKIFHQSDGGMLVAAQAIDAIAETGKAGIILKTFAAIADIYGAGEIAHHLKEEILSDMLRSFERVGELVSLIKVDKFKKEDLYRMEEISESLNVLKPLFIKANEL